MLSLNQFSNFFADMFWVATLIFLRVSAAMALLPAFGEQVTPMRIKLIIAISFSTILAPIIWEDVAKIYAEVGWLGMLMTEIVAGLSIGFLFRFFVIILQLAGTVAAQSTSLSQIFGGGLGAEPQPAISTLFVVAGLCLATLFGLHIQIIEAFVLSYQIFEPGKYIPSIDLSQWGILQVSSAFALGVSLAGPFILASFLYNLALGAISKAMPQLMVAFVGAPAISLGGLAILFITAPVILMVWVNEFFDHTDLVRGAF